MKRWWAILPLLAAIGQAWLIWRQWARRGTWEFESVFWAMIFAFWAWAIWLNARKKYSATR